MSASWDEGRAVPLTRRQDTAAASAPARLSRLDSPTHHRSFPVRNKNESTSLLAEILGLAPPGVCDPFRVIGAKSYNGLPPLLDKEPRRQAVPGGALAYAARSQRPVRCAMRREAGW